MTSESRWLFLTVGAGTLEFEEAAERLTKQAARFLDFDSRVCIKTQALINLFPELKLETFRGTRGFGYYRWKPKVIELALSGFWGNFDGVCFVDAGCEMNFNIFSRQILRKSIESAERLGALAYTISTPERWFTKRKVLEYFSAEDDYTDQFQSGTVFLHGTKGRSIAREWSEVTSLGLTLSDDTLSPVGEFYDFYEHRHDQSILSLILKKNHITSPRFHPPGAPRSKRINFWNIVSPIWWARNRSGRVSLRKTEGILQVVSSFLLCFLSCLRVGVALVLGNFVYIRFGGGLGNQLHQYSAAKAFSNRLDKVLLIDVQGIATSERGITSSATDFNLSGEVVNNPIIAKSFLFFRRVYAKLSKSYQPKGFYIAKHSGYCTDLLDGPRNIKYLEGFFHTYKYSQEISRLELNSDLVLKNQSSEWFQNNLSEMRYKRICAIHIRRGDYVDSWHHYGVLSKRYYEIALQEVDLKNVDELWIFSDSEDLDLDSWTFLESLTINLVKPPKDSCASESLVLMSRAQWIITANSTFSWWAAHLASTDTKIVVSPEPFFRSGQQINELYPGEWKKVISHWIDF